MMNTKQVMVVRIEYVTHQLLSHYVRATAAMRHDTQLGRAIHISCKTGQRRLAMIHSEG